VAKFGFFSNKDGERYFVNIEKIAYLRESPSDKGCTAIYFSFHGSGGQPWRIDVMGEILDVQEKISVMEKVQSMAKDYSRTFDSNVTSPIQGEETLEPPLDAHWDYKLLRAKAREVLTELEYETLQNALMLACKHYTQDSMSSSYSASILNEATMKLGRIFHD